MAGDAIRLENISKRYGKVEAVRNLSLSVPAGSVYGFLGPNGAGKTTTIRLLLGLQQPTDGSVWLFGRSLKTDRMALLRRTGSLVESPSLYGHLTGRENLEIYRQILGLRVSSVDDALKTVNLSDAADRLVRAYSLGMRQRLGLAMALVASPELLILDEPTNSLDPAGIHEIRSLIRDLPKLRGVTVFLSSHLLSEVEQVATHFGIISAGKLQFEGTQSELRTLGEPVLEVEVDDVERAGMLLSEIGVAARQHDRRLVIPNGRCAAEINAHLVRAGIAVSHLAVKRASLEDVFLDLTRAN